MEDSVGYGVNTPETGASISQTEITADTEASFNEPDNSINESAENHDSDMQDITNECEDASANEEHVDYAQIMREDLEVLRANFPELRELRDISELSGAMRYAALRDLGLTAIEAYLATSHKAAKRDNRSHLSTAVSHTAGAPRVSMSRGELAVARELFSGFSDAQLYSLYKRVTN